MVPPLRLVADVLTVREVAALLKVSTATVYALVDRGQFEHFRVTNAIRVHRSALDLDRQACHFGGSRPWFLCPVLHCRRRVSRLHLSKSGFRCRKCARLAYRTHAKYR